MEVWGRRFFGVVSFGFGVVAFSLGCRVRVYWEPCGERGWGDFLSSVGRRIQGPYNADLEGCGDVSSASSFGSAKKERRRSRPSQSSKGNLKYGKDTECQKQLGQLRTLGPPDFLVAEIQ